MNWTQKSLRHGPAAPQIVGGVTQATLGDMTVILNELGTVTLTAHGSPSCPKQSVSG